jgi:hypothetical protein
VPGKLRMGKDMVGLADISESAGKERIGLVRIRQVWSPRHRGLHLGGGI